MHILIIHEHFVSLTEPGGTRHYELAAYLALQGHRVTIISGAVNFLSQERIKPDQRWVEPRQLHENLLLLETFQPLLKKHGVLRSILFAVSSILVGLRVAQVDIVWGTSPSIYQVVSAWVLARIKRGKFLFEIRDLWPDFTVALGGLRSPLSRRAARWLEKFLYRQADQIVINSPGFQNHVESRGGGNIALVPNGTNAAMFYPDNRGESFRREHGLEGKFVALYAGDHGLANGLGALLEAAKRLSHLKHVVMVFLGDGAEKNNLIDISRELDLKNVIFVNPLAKVEMGQALSAADVLIAHLQPLPQFSTAYPNKVFDYMASGRPIILGIDGVIREVVETAGAGLFVTPGNPAAISTAIKTFAENPERGRAMGLAGRAYLEKNFDRTEIARQLESVLSTILKQ